MASPLISVVLCTYNGERFLEQQISSILAQTYLNLEVIIADDGSTDNTKVILRQYEKYDHVKIVYKQENVGFVKNFEAASLLTKGDYIAFSDQDDIWLPQKLEKLLSAIGNYSLVYSDSILINEEGQSLDKRLSDFRKMKKEISDSIGFSFFNVVSGHTMMIKKELLNYIFPLPDSFYHDWWIAAHAANLHGIIYLDEPLTYYRQHANTVTKTIITKKAGSRKLQARYQDYLKDLIRLELLKNDMLEKNKGFYDKVHALYLLKAERKFVLPLFYFLLRNEKAIFQFVKKSYLSKLIEIRKMARGEFKSNDA